MCLVWPKRGIHTSHFELCRIEEKIRMIGEGDGRRHTFMQDKDLEPGREVMIHKVTII